MSDQFSTAAPVPSSGELRIRWRRHELVAGSSVITVDDQTFDLTRVDRIAYHTASRINVATYAIRLGQGDKTCYFMYDAYRRDTEMDDARNMWTGVVDLLEHAVSPRLANDAIHAVLSGQTVRFGTSIVADAEGLRLRRPFAKTVPWGRLTAADLVLGNVRVWTDDSAGGKKPKMTTGMAGWNAVVLPRVITLMRNR